MAIHNPAVQLLHCEKNYYREFIYANPVNLSNRDTNNCAKYSNEAYTSINKTLCAMYNLKVIKQ